jgi:hypothetical protein
LLAIRSISTTKVYCQRGQTENLIAQSPACVRPHVLSQRPIRCASCCTPQQADGMRCARIGNPF